TQYEFLNELADTLQAWLIALGIAILLMVPIGLLTGTVDLLYRPISTVIHFARSIPATALIPIGILVFGLGIEMKVALATFAISWPIVLNVMYGVRATEPSHLVVARSLRWNNRQILKRVIFPS